MYLFSAEAVLTSTHNLCFGAKIRKINLNFFIFYNLRKICIIYGKVQVGKDQEKAQSEKDSHSKNRGGKKPN